MRGLIYGVMTLLMMACTQHGVQQPVPAVAPTQPPMNAASTPVPPVRAGRYTLVDTTPLPAQRDLLLQIIDISLPAVPAPTVATALHKVLSESGYRLCPQTVELVLLYDAPLPAPHRQLGPMTLRDALTLLAGPAWRLQVDTLHRQVCFKPIPVMPSS